MALAIYARRLGKCMQTAPTAFTRRCACHLRKALPALTQLVSSAWRPFRISVPIWQTSQMDDPRHHRSDRCRPAPGLTASSCRRPLHHAVLRRFTVRRFTPWRSSWLRCQAMHSMLAYLRCGLPAPHHAMLKTGSLGPQARASSRGPVCSRCQVTQCRWNPRL